MGAYIMERIFYLLFFIVLLVGLSPAFAPKDVNQSRLRAAFFVSEIREKLLFPLTMLELS